MTLIANARKTICAPMQVKASWSSSLLLKACNFIYKTYNFLLKKRFKINQENWNKQMICINKNKPTYQYLKFATRLQQRNLNERNTLFWGTSLNGFEAHSMSILLKKPIYCWNQKEWQHFAGCSTLLDLKP